MRTFVLAMVACGVALAAPVPKDKPRLVDEDAIQGVWLLEKFEGQISPAVELGQVRFTFKEDILEVNIGSRPASKRGTYKLDPTTKPKAIDLVNNQQQVPGIYELDGDTLRICLAEGPGATRPAEMKGDGKRVTLVTFKRVKEEKKDK